LFRSKSNPHSNPNQAEFLRTNSNQHLN